MPPARRPPPALAPSYATLATEAMPPGPPIDALPTRQVVRRLLSAERATVSAALAEADAVCLVAERAALAIAHGGRLVYAGAGTSGRLATLDAAECPPTFGVAPGKVVALMAGGRRALTRAVEGAEDRGDDARAAVRRLRLSPRDVLVAVAASGVTPFSLAALAEARARGTFTALLTCAPRPAHRALCDVVIGPRVGPEAIAGSTRLKAGTATKLVLNALSSTTMILLGKVYEGSMVDVKPASAKLRARAERMVARLAGVDHETARALLAQAGGKVKVAVVMQRRRLGRRAAERALSRAEGRLRDALAGEVGP